MNALSSIGLALASAGYAAALAAEDYGHAKAAIAAHNAMVDYERANGNCFKCARVFNEALASVETSDSVRRFRARL